jgi:hypothetical protein
MPLVRYGSYNLFEYDPTDPSRAPRLALVDQVIRQLDLDVLAVQEVRAKRPDAGLALAALAERVNMECHYAPDSPAVAANDGMLHVGLLWRPGLHVVPNSFGTSHLGYPGGSSLVRLTFEFPDGVRVQHGSKHGTPFCSTKRSDQAGHAVGTMTRPEGCAPAVLCMDSNAQSAERRADGSHYDADPYTHDLATGQKREWYNDLIFQVDWEYDAHGNRVWSADRSAGEMYLAGGLRDAAAVLGVPWAPTVGHWPTDPHGLRRIDWGLVTGHMVPALRGFQVATEIPDFDVELLKAASDHFPFVGAYETRDIDLSYSRLPSRQAADRR